MSCRVTKGNSAVTSYARYSCQSDENTVSREFHAARRDAHQTLGPDGKTKESVNTVIQYLHQFRETVTNDTNLSERNKTSLLNRIILAEKETYNGEGPNRATFVAWQRLNDYITHLPGAENVNNITLEEVDAARTRWELADQTLRQSTTHTSGRSAILQAHSLKESYTRLRASHDLTQKGFNDLRYKFGALGASDPEVEARYHAAVHALAQTQPTNLGDEQNVVHPTSNHKPNNLGNTFSLVRIAHRKTTVLARIYRQTPTAENRSLFETAKKQLRIAQHAYWETIAHQHDLPATMNVDAAGSVQAWTATTSPNIPRKDVWAAAEHFWMREDYAATKIGRLTKFDATRKALRRAEARQAILDAEGEGVIDTLNPRFAESLKRRQTS